MEKKLNIGDQVLIFKNGSFSTDGIKPYTTGKVIECIISDVDVYKVLDEDGIVHKGCYKDNVSGYSILLKAKDYKEYLKRIVEGNKEKINELEQSNRRTEIALSFFGTSYEEKKAEMEKCDHLFVKLKEGEDYYGFHSSDCGHDSSIVKCVHCGLTNKYVDMSYTEKRFICMFPAHNISINLNNEMFSKKFSHAYRRGGKSFDESVFNLISNEVFTSDHPGLLYRIAKMINPDASNEELFEIMKKLQELETTKERISLNSMEQVDSLIERYNNRDAKKLAQ